MSAPPVLGWGTVHGTRGSRHHAVITLEPFEVVGACGVLVTGLFRDEEPEWDADVPCPPRMCPDCRKELGR